MRAIFACFESICSRNEVVFRNNYLFMSNQKKENNKKKTPKLTRRNEVERREKQLEDTKHTSKPEETTNFNCSND